VFAGSARLVAAATISLAMSMSCADRESGPARGVWDFEPEMVWETGRVGGTELKRPAEPRVSPDGVIYFHDFDTKKSMIIDANGEYLGTFAAAGTGPGMVSNYLNCFLSRNEVVVGTPDKLHFFDRQGTFLRSIPNNLFLRFPLAFIDDHIVFMGPGALCNLPECEVTVSRVNLETGAEKEIHRFEVSDDENFRFGGVIIGLIPQIKMDYDTDSGLIYFGRNDRYEIIAADRDGLVKRTFGLQCERADVSESTKRAHFENFGIPPERYESILPMLPQKLTYYHRIQILDGRVFIFRMDELSSRRNRQDIDIFSREGRYLYRGRIVLPPGDYFENPDQLHLGDGYLYVILRDDDGGRRIARYRVRMPV
ncbi:MAG TPA: hypothetical protein VLA34_02625, partial [Candidatus Krumholzibacterium sp.]|nr:hypothetical protein [Candidatus Krumholzibacterium sp.]